MEGSGNTVAFCRPQRWDRLCKGDEAQHARDLLAKLIVLEKEKRLNAKEALEHELFKECV